MTSELDAAGGGACTKVAMDSSICRAGITVADCDDVWLTPEGPHVQQWVTRCETAGFSSRTSLCLCKRLVGDGSSGSGR